jgi:hypothetical protein
MRQAPASRKANRSSDVAALVRLHHRRRGWAWVAVGSLVGIAVWAGIGASLSGSLTGTAETFSLILLFVLLALMLTGFVVVIIDTLLLRRAHPAARSSAKRGVSHHPLYAQAHRYPPRHHGSWVFGIVMLVAMTGIAVAVLPAEVNSIAYVAGAEHRDSFIPVSYGQSCNWVRRGMTACHTVTAGYMSSSRADVTWGSQVPLGQPIAVHDPLWAWGTGRNLISGNGSAIGVIIAGLFFDAVALVLLYALVVMVRYTPTPSRTSSRRR